MTSALASGCEKLTKLRPNLKRKRDEMKALAEIRREQRNTDDIIDKDAFERLVLEVGQDVRGNIQFEPEALAALQAASEDYLVKLFDMSVAPPFTRPHHRLPEGHAVCAPIR